MRTRLAVVLIGAAMATLTATAASAVGVQDADPDGSAEIAARSFGLADGLRIERGVVDASGAGTLAAASTATTFSRGTTWVMNQEINDLVYQGSSRAYGNVFNGARYVSALFRYTRNGAALIPWQSSSARSNGACGWTAGPLTVKQVSDTLDPNAPVTRFAFDFRSINPSIC